MIHGSCNAIGVLSWCDKSANNAIIVLSSKIRKTLQHSKFEANPYMLSSSITHCQVFLYLTCALYRSFCNNIIPSQLLTQLAINSPTPGRTDGRREAFKHGRPCAVANRRIGIAGSQFVCLIYNTHSVMRSASSCYSSFAVQCTSFGSV